jgi:predicted DNA-binding transcriptional regulator YafY
VDAVQSSRFITQKKSRELISKIEGLTNRFDATKLQRQVYVAGRVKTENESIYYHVDTLHNAIQDNKQITFQYLEWNHKKELLPRKEGKRYKVSPWSLIWQDERYYLAAYDEERDSIRHYRVDKMADIEILQENRIGQAQYEKVDLASYTNKTFGMYGGKEELVTLQFPESLVGVVIDRFGKDISIRKDGDKVRARVNVNVSNQFYGWLMGIGKDIEIVSPADIRQEYSDKLQEIWKQYT